MTASSLTLALSARGATAHPATPVGGGPTATTATQRSADTPVARAALVDVDATLFVVIGLFLLFYVTLRFALFRPVLRLFEEREKRIDGAKHEAKDMQERAVKAVAQYEAFVREARAQGQAEKETLRQEGQRIAREILDEVRREAAAEVAKSKAELQAELAQATAQIDREAHALAREAATRLLGRPLRKDGEGRSLQ